jgi:hypothetical protein
VDEDAALIGALGDLLIGEVVVAELFDGKVIHLVSCWNILLNIFFLK